VNIALLTFKTDQIGKGLDYVGVHHFGVLVEDPAAATDSLLEAGATKLDIAEGDPDDGGFEIKFRDPDGIVFDIAGTAWLGTSLDD
jgi:catechol 2,3-dioxygenase-like lactoylglutathione lyase family enzyme